MKQLIVFDLDGTLAPSKSAIDAEMAQLLVRLLDAARVAVISGGGFPQFQAQFLANLPKDDRLARLSLLPTCGTRFYRYEAGDWALLYAEDFTPEQRARIETELQKAVDDAGFTVERTWGPQIEDRGSQITYSALGQEAPLEAKATWDPDFAKRKVIQALLAESLPDFSVNLGGTTSIDVTKPGIDKAYGMYKLRDILGIPIEDMVFIGDALFPGGNDYPARTTGADCVQVKDPSYTKVAIEALLTCI